MDSLYLEEPNPEKYDHNVWCKNVKTVVMPSEVAGHIMTNHKNLLNKALEKGEISSDHDIFGIIRKIHPLALFADKLTEEIFKAKFSNGCFAKMHRSPKDSNWDNKDLDIDDDLNYLRCNNGDEVLTKFMKSIRIYEDLKDFIPRGVPLNVYLLPYRKPKLVNEFRAFIVNREVTMIRQTPLTGSKPIYTEGQIKQFANKAYEQVSQGILDNGYKIDDVYKRCCIDFEINDGSNTDIDDKSPIRIFEVNPFDCTTDLYE